MSAVARDSSTLHQLTLAELIAKWTTREDTLRALSARVDGGSLCQQFVQDLSELAASGSDDSLALPAAARESGYTEHHLRRLIKRGALQAVGTGRNRRIRRRDLPRKPRRVAPDSPSGELPVATAGQDVRIVVDASIHPQ